MTQRLRKVWKGVTWPFRMLAFCFQVAVDTIADLIAGDWP